MRRIFKPKPKNVAPSLRSSAAPFDVRSSPLAKKSGCGRRSSLGRARAGFAGPIALREEERDDADDERLRRGKKSCRMTSVKGWDEKWGGSLEEL